MIPVDEADGDPRLYSPLYLLVAQGVAALTDSVIDGPRRLNRCGHCGRWLFDDRESGSMRGTIKAYCDTGHGALARKKLNKRRRVALPGTTKR